MNPAELQQRLEELIARHEVPGASIAVLAGADVSTAAAGVLNVNTGVTATQDSLFQIGSLTKMYTTAVVMQLVDEGRVELDTPVVSYLPELALRDADAAEKLTLRHLLTHTSGIDGDYFPDLGRGDDVLARFVAGCAELNQIHPLGATMSYCNAGFCIAGRVIEHATGQTWDDAVANRLAAPLELDHTVTRLEDVLRFRSAIGHTIDNGAVRTVPTWGLPFSCGPAGLICATATDVVAFAQLYLDQGRAPDGRQILSAESVAEMSMAQVAVPGPNTSAASLWGLGLMLYDSAGPAVIGHDGTTIGQAAFLRIVPEAGVAVALVTNGGRAHSLYEDLVKPLVQELAGATLPEPPEPPADPVDVDPEPHLGVYERMGTRIEIERRDSGLVGRFTATGPLPEPAPGPVTECELVAVRPDLYLAWRQADQLWDPVIFYRLENGVPYLQVSGRATPKVA